MHGVIIPRPFVRILHPSKTEQTNRRPTNKQNMSSKSTSFFVLILVLSIVLPNVHSAKDDDEDVGECLELVRQLFPS